MNEDVVSQLQEEAENQLEEQIEDEFEDKDDRSLYERQKIQDNFEREMAMERRIEMEMELDIEFEHQIGTNLSQVQWDWIDGNTHYPTNMPVFARTTPGSAYHHNHLKWSIS